MKTRDVSITFHVPLRQKWTVIETLLVFDDIFDYIPRATYQKWTAVETLRVFHDIFDYVPCATSREVDSHRNVACFRRSFPDGIPREFHTT